MKRLALVALALLLLAPAAAAEGAEQERSLWVIVEFFAFMAVIVVLVLALAFWLTRRNFHQRMATFTAFAERNNLRISDTEGWFPNLEVEGTWGRRRLTLDTYTVRAGKSSTTYTRLRLSIDPPFDGHLKLRYEGLLAKLGKRFGTEDLQLHDVRFDPRYIVQCSDPALPEVVLRQNVREKLLRFKMYHFSWDGDEAEAERVGEGFDAERLQALLEILAEVAEELERYAARAAR